MQKCHYLVEGEDRYVYSRGLFLGIRFLLGCRLQFNEDATFEMVFIGENDEEVTKDHESEQEPAAADEEPREGGTASVREE